MGFADALPILRALLLLSVWTRVCGRRIEAAGRELEVDADADQKDTGGRLEHRSQTPAAQRLAHRRRPGSAVVKAAV